MKKTCFLFVLGVMISCAGVAYTESRESPSLSPPKGLKVVGSNESGPVTDLPRGNQGIASQYSGDRGIEKDSAVIFVEGFDGGLDEARWDTVKNKETLSVSNDRPPGSAGRHSLLVEHVKGKAGGELYRRLLPGYEKVFVRL